MNLRIICQRVNQEESQRIFAEPWAELSGFWKTAVRGVLYRSTLEIGTACTDIFADCKTSVSTAVLWEKKTTSSRHQHIGISKGGQTTKIHAVVDALGYPIKLLLSAGNVNDITVAPKLIDDLSTKSKDVADIFVSLVQIHLWSVGKLMNINTVKVTMSSVFSNCWKIVAELLLAMISWLVVF